MPLSPRLFACAFALLALSAAAANADPAPPPAPAAGAAPVSAKDTPAVAVVREFLADRAAGKYEAAFALLSSSSRTIAGKNNFTGKSAPIRATLKEKSLPVYGLAVLITDPRDTLHYTFTVLGPDPADPQTVLLRAAPPASAAGVPAVITRLVTVEDPVDHAPRLDVQASLSSIDPQVVAEEAKGAKRAASQANLKRIGLGVIEYEQDHDEIAPDAAHWVDQIMPYVKDKKVFHDPAASAGQTYSYAYNRALSHQELAMMEDPAHTVLAFESTAGVKNAADTGQSVPRPGRYDGGTDFLFADGHVKWLPDGAKPSFKLTGK